MKATLMWTINDFSTYEMVSGWNMQRKIACLYYMKNNMAFILTNSAKVSFFNCHQLFFPTNHNFRKNKNEFVVGRVDGYCIVTSFR